MENRRFLIIDLKSLVAWQRVGSIPTPGTNKIKELCALANSLIFFIAILRLRFGMIFRDLWRLSGEISG